MFVIIVIVSTMMKANENQLFVGVVFAKYDERLEGEKNSSFNLFSIDRELWFAEGYNNVIWFFHIDRWMLNKYK